MNSIERRRKQKRKPGSGKCAKCEHLEILRLIDVNLNNMHLLASSPLSASQDARKTGKAKVKRRSPVRKTSPDGGVVLKPNGVAARNDENMKNGVKQKNTAKKKRKQEQKSLKLVEFKVRPSCCFLPLASCRVVQLTSICTEVARQCFRNGLLGEDLRLSLVAGEVRKLAFFYLDSGDDRYVI